MHSRDTMDLSMPGPDRPPAQSQPIPQGPYYMPPYYPMYWPKPGPPMDVVDQRLPQVSVSRRPLALKFAIVLLIIGITLCIVFLILRLNYWRYSPIFSIFLSLFSIITILGIISIIFLLIPKKVGWYFAFITAVIALSGLGIGTLIAIFTIFALMWPSTRYYFHTGQYPPQSPTTSYPPYAQYSSYTLLQNKFQSPPRKVYPPRRNQ